jgi:predicted transcriptional regulator of viral defense system
MSRDHTRRILELTQAHGLLRTRDLDRLGIPRTYLTRLVRSGELERVGRGLYALPGSLQTEHQSLALVAKRVPAGVICLLSALAFHQLTAQSPWEVWLAVAYGSRTPKLDYPPLRVVRYKRESLEAGVETHLVEGVDIRVFNPAKTIADCFKYRRQVGLDVAIEALKEGWRARSFTVEALLEYARLNRVERVIHPYLEAVMA